MTMPITSTKIITFTVTVTKSNKLDLPVQRMLSTALMLPILQSLRVLVQDILFGSWLSSKGTLKVSLRVSHLGRHT